MFQRAIWATIIRIYSYGKAIFSTSFESAATPKQAMTAFMSANLDFLRELVITEINNNTPADQQRGRVVHPQSYTPVPIDGLIVSQGTLTDTIFTVTPATEETTLQVSMPAPASATETLTQYTQRIGLTEETTYTIMANIVDKDINILYPVKINSPYAINYQSYFGAVRLTLKHQLSEKPISQATLADLFDIVRIGNTFTPSFSDIAFGTGTWYATTLLRNINAIGTLAVSAYNTTTQQVSNSAMNWIKLQNTYGIISKYTIPIWGKAEQTTNNEYIPEEPKPYDYKIEFLESTGTQGIIIDIETNPTEMEIIAMSINNKGDNVLVSFGTQWTWPNLLFFTSYLFLYAMQNQAFVGVPLMSKIRLVKKGNTIQVYSNNEYLGERTLADNITINYPIYILKNEHTYGIGRIYLFEIKNVIRLIPVVKNGEPCMYDEINGKIYYKSGTDNFIAGPKID